MRLKVAFLGAGSHADAILPILDRETYEFVGFFDDKDIAEHDGYPVLGKLCDSIAYIERNEIDRVLVTIGDNVKRKEIFDLIARDHYDALFNVISPNATVLTPESVQGRGIFIGFNAFVGAKVTIKDNNVINTGALVEHHTHIEAHCNIAPNATVNGLCTLHEGVYIGSASVTIQLLSIAPYTTVGAGAVVVRSITESGTYVGVPARKIK